MKRKAIEQAQAIDHTTDDAAAFWRTDASVLRGLKPYESKFSHRTLANVSMVDNPSTWLVNATPLIATERPTERLTRS